MKWFQNENGRRHREIADTATKTMLTIVVATVVFVGLMHFFGGGKEDSFRQVKSQLEKLEGISVLKTGGKDDALILTDVFASFEVESRGILTVGRIRPESFEQIENEILLRVGDWGIATVTLHPDSQEDRVRHRHGIQIAKDADFKQRTAGVEIRELGDLVSHYDDLSDYVSSLPELSTPELDLEFLKANAQRKNNDWGFGGHYYAVRCRFRTDYLGSPMRDYNKQPEAVPTVSNETVSAMVDVWSAHQKEAGPEHSP